MTLPTCGDCGQVVNRQGHAPGCRRLKIHMLTDGDARVEQALRDENGQSPKKRAHHVAWVGAKAIAARAHVYDRDADRCQCGGCVVYFEDGDRDGWRGEGCEVADLVWPALAGVVIEISDFEGQLDELRESGARIQVLGEAPNHAEIAVRVWDAEALDMVNGWLEEYGYEVRLKNGVVVAS